MKNRWLHHFRSKSTKNTVSRLPFFVQTVFNVDREISRVFIINYIEFWEKSVLHKGEIWTVKFLKDLYGSCLRFSVGHSFPEFRFCKVGKFGLPLLVKDLIPLLTGSLNERRAALYLLQIYKLALVEGEKPSLETITEKFHRSIDWNDSSSIGEIFYKLSKDEFGEDFAIDLSNRFNRVIESFFPKNRLKQRIRKLSKLNSLYITPKKGPNGLSINSIISDMISLKKTTLWKTLKDYTYRTKNKVLRRIMIYLDLVSYEYVEDTNLSEDEFITSKLSIKFETGGKTRFFAIVDWFTQSALQGLHTLLFQILSEIPEDGTFDHSKISKLLSIWTIDEFNPKLDYSSMDLSSATDRLPSGLQYLILKEIVGEDLSKSWLEIMTNRDFRVPDSQHFVKYGCGQPMGALSSWAMLAVTHHIIASVCLTYEKSVWNSGLPPYGIIGDDIALLGTNSTKIYSIIMDKILGVSVNPIKGYTSVTLTGENNLEYGIPNKVVEIAKRVVVNGYEITPGSPNTLKAYLDSPENFISLLNDLHDRGVLIDPGFNTFELIADLGYHPRLAMEYALFPPLPARPFTVGFDKSAETFLNLQKYCWYKSTDISVEDIQKYLLNKFKKRILSSIEEKYDNIFDMNRAISPIEEGKVSSLIHSKGRVLALRSINRQLNQELIRFNELIGETYPIPETSFNKMAKTLDNISDLSELLVGLPTKVNYKSKLSRARATLMKDLQKDEEKRGSNKNNKTLNNYELSSSTVSLLASAIEVSTTDDLIIDNLKRNYITPNIISLDWVTSNVD